MEILVQILSLDGDHLGCSCIFCDPKVFIYECTVAISKNKVWIPFTVSLSPFVQMCHISERDTGLKWHL